MMMIKQLRKLLDDIAAAEKRGGLLLLDNLTAETVAKLQSMTDDNVIVIFTKDGTRMEIRKDRTDMVPNRGMVR